jgi:FAD:protein FMN transferase
MSESASFHAMGSECFVAVLGGNASALLTLAPQRAEQLEQAWSRFRPDSEMSRLNQSGQAIVSSDTFLLIEHAVTAWKWTNGVFDPSVLELVTQSGYDRSFEQIVSTPATPTGAVVDGLIRPKSKAAKAPGCADVQLDYETRSVTLPTGVGLDPGGIGKGLAADLITETLVDAGAKGALVSMGGDVRAFGEEPDGGWQVGIADPQIDGNVIAQISLGQQGLATSNRTIRKWTHEGVERNHLIHPETGRSASGPSVAVSVIAGQAWWAEVLAKVAILGGVGGAAMAHALGGKVMIIDEHNTVTVTEGWNLGPQVAQDQSKN